MSFLNSSPLVALPLLGYCLFAVFIVSIFLYRSTTRRRQTPKSRTPPPEKAGSVSSFKRSDRIPGVWPPSDFVTPLPPPYPNWSLSTPPLPYRPFRHGPKYFITMGLRRLSFSDWIELDSDYLSYHSQKASRIISRGKKCCDTLPSALPHAYELLEELCRYLPARYPSLYRKTDRGMDNIVTGESFDIMERPLKEDPMQMAARWVQDDLAIMVEGGDGQYYLQAGATLLTGFWRLGDKMGMGLDEIHRSGDVPGFESKLRKGMENFFGRLKVEECMGRSNYFIQVDGELPWSPSIGSEDGQPGEFGWFTAEGEKPIEQIYFRSERQSLRRLPKTGGVVFTIRTYFVPVTEIVKEPYVPGRLASAIRSWDDDVAKYKGRERYEKVLLAYLDKEHQKQVEAGLPLEKEEEVVSYPF
ncbi:Similar to conserved hypothetical protein [Aspergillus fumigatus Af293]; acc. no. XP_752756 [Pyronema omphalodes CBS 100304]|uniref:Uncharacterized protein n=1 Tax=Pyronema omphalodes (strain CBS 100304) TaxID=1076935 RepID=U4KY59_PYROM|nr:Similar to conserved hypothetical protein [Aspergillus fumigatus Af293]; acc. no. XP_752756 [Pyronema omphalodes CBS 100304]